MQILYYLPVLENSYFSGLAFTTYLRSVSLMEINKAAMQSDSLPSILIIKISHLWHQNQLRFPILGEWILEFCFTDRCLDPLWLLLGGRIIFEILRTFDTWVRFCSTDEYLVTTECTAGNCSPDVDCTAVHCGLCNMGCFCSGDEREEEQMCAGYSWIWNVIFWQLRKTSSRLYVELNWADSAFQS